MFVVELLLHFCPDRHHLDTLGPEIRCEVADLGSKYPQGPQGSKMVGLNNVLWLINLVRRAADSSKEW